MIKNEDADQMYDELLGSPLLAVPCGSPQRLKQWPGLSGKLITVKGNGWNESACDIVLSSAGEKFKFNIKVCFKMYQIVKLGWVAVTGEKDTEYNLNVHTPYGRGIHIRTPPLLPRAVMLRGARLDRSPGFRNNGLFLK